MTSIGEPSAREGHSAVWTGHQMIVWGGDGSQYDPATDRWRPLQLSSLAKPRTGHVAAWTGSAMIAWGGFGGNRAEVPLFDGVMFTPTGL